LDTCYPYPLYLSEQGCEDPWLFSKLKGVCEQKSLGNTGLVIFHTFQFGVAHFIATLRNKKILQC